MAPSEAPLGAILQASIIRTGDDLFKVTYYDSKQIVAFYFLSLEQVLVDLRVHLKDFEITEWRL